MVKNKLLTATIYPDTLSLHFPEENIMSHHSKESLISNTLTVAQLIEHLQELDQDAPVFFTADYGDYCHTTQALDISEVKEDNDSTISSSGYSRSGFAYEETDDNEDLAGYCHDCDKDYYGIDTCPSCKQRLVDEDGDKMDLDNDGQTIVVIS